MRKADLVIILGVAGLAGSIWHSRPAEPSSTAAVQSRGVFRLAGLTLGMSTDEIEKCLGKAQQRADASGSRTLSYSADGAQLWLWLVNDRLLAIQAQGRWMLQWEGRPLPAFGAQRQQVHRALGAPKRQTPTLDSFQQGDLELSFTYGNDAVVRVVLIDTSEIPPPEALGGKS